MMLQTKIMRRCEEAAEDKLITTSKVRPETVEAQIRVDLDTFEAKVWASTSTLIRDYAQVKIDITENSGDTQREWCFFASVNMLWTLLQDSLPTTLFSIDTQLQRDGYRVFLQIGAESLLNVLENSGALHNLYESDNPDF